ncbi:MAG: indole-3-glycerol phosphate synthase TrpC [Dysgonamonadaceae bacterium]|jgi:indole-3-glycerol phosphate synthase|nr:indole-3-glycerol phosphate synthase TrpC [Dysgonamonadaceae bacterium]
MKDVLSEIVAHKKREVEERRKRRSIDDLCKIIEEKNFPFRSLKQALEHSDTGIISEFKRRSPSKGWINQSADVAFVARGYESAGASAMSVLTDEDYFGGSDDDLKKAVSMVKIPVLRKEFIVDEFQIYESKSLGANVVLLIASAITPQQCKRFTEVASLLRLDVLLELHDEKELDYVSDKNDLVGINNRNLGTFATTVDKSFRMAELLPRDVVRVSESGISSPSIVKELRSAGYRGFLIGENFMKTANPGESLKQFIEELKA